MGMQNSGCCQMTWSLLYPLLAAPLDPDPWLHPRQNFTNF
jgi:hypothetical protein